MKKEILIYTGLIGMGVLAAKQPNVLFILTDDQGWGDVSIHGNPIINTPTLDMLYSKSVVLNNFYVSPLSAPTRASLLTGRYHLSTGVSSVQSGLENMRAEETTLAELFKSKGYATGCFGKWHNGTYFPLTPNGQGFDDFVGFCCGHWANYFDPILQKNEKIIRGKGYISDIFADEAIRFINENKENPFFCYLPFNTPHSPFQVPDEYFNRYDHIKASTPEKRNGLACIYGMVENIDYNISRVLNHLDSLKIRENTIIIFMSDNGPVHIERYNGGMRGMKGQTHEGGVRVPCYINWQGKLNHKIINQVTTHIDILPTLMELCSITNYTTAFPLDGIDLTPLILGNITNIPYRQIFTHRMQNTLVPFLGAVRTPTHRLIVNRDSLLLFDIMNDPQEKNNLYAKEFELGNQLLNNYMNWFNCVKGGVNTNFKVPVGYLPAPQVRIPAPEGKMHGKLKCYGYPNQNWVNHFTTEADSLTFELDVVENGLYEVAIQFTNTSYNNNTKITAQIHNTNISKGLPSFYPESVPSPDRMKRVEAYEQTWATISLGKIDLSKNNHKLKVFVENASSTNSVEIKTIYINRLK